ncbi:MAG TPA: ribonuclease Z [Candidatus Nanoarchaeia archaeon]|nr:ribonuclease Z [Candidatus Nanoarchaeia archaeon]
MEITFLGTSCMVPTKERNVSAIYLEHKGEGILIDCGEGTQRQMNIAGINRVKVKKVLISHWHGDHVAGLIGLLQTIGNVEKEDKSIQIFGPVGSKEKMDHLLQCTYFYQKFDIQLHELNPKGVERFFEGEDYYLECTWLEHSVPCLGFSFIEKDRRKMDMDKAGALGLKSGPLLGKLQDGVSVELKGKTISPQDVSHTVKGKKISVIWDTVFTQACLELAKDADLLICESSYTADLKEKAEEYKHLTTEQAGFIATNANVNELIITHFSQRYKTAEVMEEEIKTFFQNSRCAFDFMKVKV